MTTESPFVDVPLYLASGEPLGVVAQIPPFVVPPDVLMWGSRVFMRTEPVSATETQYRECFAVAVVKTQFA